MHNNKEIDHNFKVDHRSMEFETKHHLVYKGEDLVKVLFNPNSSIPYSTLQESLNVH